MTTFEHVQKQLKQHHVKDVELSTRFVDRGFDSLDLITLVMEIELIFNLEIPDQEVDKFVTVGDLVSYIERNKTGDC